MYEVLAVRYGLMRTTRSENFYRYGVYGEPDAPMPMDYFLWLLRGEDETILVDTGYHPAAAAARHGRICLIPPMDALSRLGVDPAAVSRIVVTHFHFDHIGNVRSFPNARITLQQAEFDYWLGPHGTRPAMAASVEAAEIEYLRRAAEQGLVDTLSGDAELNPHLRVMLVGGHCPGQQIVIVAGERPVVLASDALHFYEEMDRYMPFEVFSDLPEMYRTYDLLRRLRDDSAVIIAGHDPLVMSRFPALTGHENIAVRVS